MTASTAPITLPATTGSIPVPSRHRADADIWPFHVLVAWIAYALQLAGWHLLAADQALGRRHLIAIAIAAAIVLLAPLSLAALAAHGLL